VFRPILTSFSASVAKASSFIWPKLAIIVIIFSFNPIQAQVDTTETIALDSAGSVARQDTIILKPQKTHSPRKAVFLSMALPGAGQVYNRKYWKVIPIYGALGSTIFFAIENHRQYNEFWNAFLTRIDTNSNKVPDRFEGIYTESQLISLINQRLNQRDLMIILAVVSYAVQLVDAYVDAHLFTYDISDNLTLEWRPSVQIPTHFNTSSVGVQTKLTLDNRNKKKRQILATQKLQ
jgi:hypothetical protein